MRPASESARHFMVGGGIASLTAAVLLVRDARVPGERITILEHQDAAGGSLDGSGDASSGYLTRGGRMFEPQCVCLLDVLKSIPAPDNPTISIRDDIFAFNRAVLPRSNCRLIREGRRAEDWLRLGLAPTDIVSLNRLLLARESAIEGRSIEDWFAASFFGTNFWIMWSTMFSFQPWHSLIEMRRYIKRFLHLFPGLTRLSGILRTRYNQYDSVVTPICAWLADRGVTLHSGRGVTDVTIVGDLTGRRVTALHLSQNEIITVNPEDKVYLTLGSMTDGSVNGSTLAPPPRADGETPSFDLWRRLAARYEGLGRPQVFTGDQERTSWTSFTVTLASPAFIQFMENFTANKTGTGGLVTFADSRWMLSIVIFNQPHFRNQPTSQPVFWGYGLRGDQQGDVIAKPMARATGAEILDELAGQLRLSPDQRADFFDGARVIPCRMPVIVSQFMPRCTGDRPPVIPTGSENFAVIGQFCEIPRDCVFTVEYSVRSAWTAVSSLTGQVSAPPPVVRSDVDPRVLLRAARVLLAG